MMVEQPAKRGHRHTEIARIPGVTEGAVRYYLRRAAAGATDRRAEYRRLTIGGRSQTGYCLHLPLSYNRLITIVTD
jgi:predicted transcriptional regulator